MCYRFSFLFKLFLTIFILLLVNKIVFAIPLNDNTNSSEFKAIMAGNCGDHLYSSSDGLYWSQIQIPTSDAIYGITYDGYKYIAVGDNGVIISSIDGISWVLQKALPITLANSIVYNKNKYIVVGIDGVILISSDGINWTTIKSLTNKDLFNVTYINNQFFASGRDGTLLYSSNGIEWNIAQTNIKDVIVGIAYGNGKYISITANGKVSSSIDSGKTWNIIYDLNADEINKIIFDGKYFIAVGIKTDWSKRPIPVEANLFISENGFNWQLISTNVNRIVRDIAYYKENHLIAGTGTTVFQSNDVLNWTQGSVIGGFCNFNAIVINAK